MLRDMNVAHVDFPQMRKYVKDLRAEKMNRRKVDRDREARMYTTTRKQMPPPCTKKNWYHMKNERPLASLQGKTEATDPLNRLECQRENDK